MPSENEELDIFKNRKWRPFVNLLRGAPCLSDELVLREFDRCFVSTLRRACKLLKVKELITACVNGDIAEVERLRREHRQQRDRAETFADQIEISCEQGMTYRAAVDAFVHDACARIVDQAGPAVFPSDNFPTIDDYRQASAIWMFRMEERISQFVGQIIEDPAKLRAVRVNKTESNRRVGEQLGWSLMDGERKDRSDGSTLWNGH